MIDVVIPSHEKDIDTIDLCIDSIRQNVRDVGRVVVVSRNKLTDNAEFFPEEDLPFSLEDVGNIIGFHHKIFNYYADLIQATAPMEIPDLSNNILVCDSDTIFTRPVEFFDEDGVALYSPSYDIPKHVYNHPYLEHAEKMIPGLTKQTEYSGIVHHMLMQKHILGEIYDKVEERTGMPFWKATLTAATEEFKCLDPRKKIEDCPLRMTIYELYFNYVLKYHKEDVALRPLNSILAYKGILGIDNEPLHGVGSRTNLKGNIQVIPREEELKHKFKSTKESLQYISTRCGELGYDSVTFQNHTRIGTKTHEIENLSNLSNLIS